MTDKPSQPCCSPLPWPDWPSRPGRRLAGQPAPEGAKVYIISPGNAAIVPQMFTVRFGLKAMGGCPGRGRKPQGRTPPSADRQGRAAPGRPAHGQDVKHFGGGQTEAEITLPPDLTRSS